MASLVKQKTGLTFVKLRLDGREVRIRFGRSGKPADARHIEELVRYRGDAESAPLDAKTVSWLKRQPDKVYRRLAEVGLVEGREEVAAKYVDQFAQYCIGLKRRSVKKSSVIVYQNTAANLVEFFGRRHLTAVTAHEVDKFKVWLETEANRAQPGKGLAASTVGKRLKVSREWFDIAKERGWISRNPFRHLKGLDRDCAGPDERKVYVGRDVVQQLIENAADNEERLLLALWRFAGLRQLEPMNLEWDHISWESDRMTVTASKQTSQSKIHRVIPVWPEVRSFLLQQAEEAPRGCKWVIWRRRYSYDSAPERRGTGSALYSRLERQLFRQGIPPWPKLNHNMRASGETDRISEGYPSHVVAYWWNHDERVQEKHYLTVPDEFFDRATQAGEGVDDYGHKTARD